MVKGISRQVLVVRPPHPGLFEQAIFILKDSAVENGGITDGELLEEAKRILREQHPAKRGNPVFWCGLGALVTGLAWLISALV